MTRHAPYALFILIAFTLAVFGQAIVKGLEACAGDGPVQCPGEME